MCREESDSIIDEEHQTFFALEMYLKPKIGLD